MNFSHVPQISPKFKLLDFLQRMSVNKEATLQINCIGLI